MHNHTRHWYHARHYTRDRNAHTNTVPGAALERFRMTSVRVFAAAQNVFTVTNYSGFSPELAGGPLDSGIDSFTETTSAYPISRTITLGLNINFK